MSPFIQNLPKAELHLHIEGTLEPELMFELAQRNGVEIPFSSVTQVREAYQFTNLQSFLDIYYQGAQVLIHEQDFHDLTMAYMEKLSQQNVRHIELFFDPQTHTERGVEFVTALNGIHGALLAAEAKFGISSMLIMCFLRHMSAESAERTLDQALAHKDIIRAVGLDSGELGNPPEKFKDVFSRAREEGFLCVAHAGEEGPPEYIWSALQELKVQRIDHGVRCAEDEKLLDYLRDRQIPLTVCPLSNTALKVFEHMAQHNIRELLQRGLLVTVNSDDPAYFKGQLNDNYAAVQDALGFTDGELAQLAKNSFIGSFLSEAKKQQYIREIDRYTEVL